MSPKIGLLGKHPAYGDFLRHEVDDPVADRLTAWVDNTLAEVKEQLGDNWGAFWDGAQELRFWIGRAVLGQTLCGILHPSADKVGRRYPLILLVQGAKVEPPVAATGQELYDALSAHIPAMTAGTGAAALLEGLSAETLGLQAEDDLDRAAGPVIWAHHPEGDLTALLAAAAPVDAARAATIRSHWWAPGGDGRAATWLGQAGLPTAAALSWALGGVAQDPTAEGEKAEHAQQ